MCSKHVLVPFERFQNLLELERKSFQQEGNYQQEEVAETAAPKQLSPQPQAKPQAKPQASTQVGLQSPGGVSSTDSTVEETAAVETPGVIAEDQGSHRVVDLKGAGDLDAKTVETLSSKRLRPPGVRQNKWLSWK